MPQECEPVGMTLTKRFLERRFSLKVKILSKVSSSFRKTGTGKGFLKL